MNAVDTNILVYYLDQNEVVKQAKAISLVNGFATGQAQTVLLWQVLAEFVRQLRSWQDAGKLTRSAVLGYVAHVRNSFPIVMPTPNVLDTALDLAGRYSLSHWDSMILGACKVAGVTTLYTEDMGAPITYDGINLINPFARRIMFSLSAIQSALRDLGFDGWLLYDFRGSNVLARRVLEIDGQVPGSRRLFYFVPAQGTPRKLVHRIESGALDHLPGEKQIYLKWQELEAGVAAMIQGCRRLAMEYSPRNANPYISRVDAGTIELVRSGGCEIQPSGDLIQLFEATWDDEQWQMHLEADRHTRSAFDMAFGLIAERVRSAGSISELEVQQAIMAHFREHGMTTYHPPIVGVGPHSGDPHYETGTGQNTTIKADTFVLIDLWAKLDKPRAVYSDLTRVGFVGKSVPKKYEEIFQIVARARDAGIACVRDAFAAGRVLRGWEVDQATRDVIEQAGYGQHFVHRTGHSIGQETHGNGANMDNLETHEERRVMRRTCFSIEPGIYLPEFGVRSEVNVFVDAAGQVHVTGGPPQTSVLPILAA